MEQTECSETSAYKIQTLRNFPEERIQHSEHGKNFKSRICINVTGKEFFFCNYSGELDDTTVELEDAHALELEDAHALELEDAHALELEDARAHTHTHTHTQSGRDSF
jgi:hypothetical protein